MSKRMEFSRKTKAQAFERCGGNCEGCGARLKTGEAEYDHTIPCALGGDNSLSNCQVLCIPCHRGENGKTANDIRVIRKADRSRDKQNGAIQPKSPLAGRKSPKSPLTKIVQQRRSLYEPAQPQERM